MSHVLVLCVSVIFCTCDMYKSSPRHIHYPVLLSQDGNYTCNFFFCYFQISCVSLVQCLTVSSPTYVSILLSASMQISHYPSISVHTSQWSSAAMQHSHWPSAPVKISYIEKKCLAHMLMFVSWNNMNFPLNIFLLTVFFHLSNWVRILLLCVNS